MNSNQIWMDLLMEIYAAGEFVQCIIYTLVLLQSVQNLSTRP